MREIPSAGCGAAHGRDDRVRRLLWRAAMVGLLLAGTVVAQGQRVVPAKVLILTNAPQEQVGPARTAHLYAIFLRNLLGADPDLAVEVRHATSYRSGEADRYLRVFYLGSAYDGTVPDALVRDVRNGAAVTWIHYGIWDVAPAGDAAARDAVGLEYVTLHRSEPPTDPAAFDEVHYRGHVFVKEPVAMEAIETRPAAGSTVHAWMHDDGGRRIPYVTQAGAFWYVADLPFAYTHERDRYLVFADLLPSMLGRGSRCPARALVRLEDLHPAMDPEGLRLALDVLEDLDVPFAAAVIPRYANNRAAREGRPEARIAWSDRPEALAQLRRVPALGGRIFQHGTTHQFEGLDNPSGESGVDWEFWDVEADEPIASLPPERALERVRAGLRVLEEELSLPVAGWVTPHYAFDPAMGEGLARVHPVAFERRLYGSDGADGSQFFPYPIRDAYGSIVIPENGGHLHEGRRQDDLLAAARANRALGCPWFGFFVHPYLLSPEYAGPAAMDPEDLVRLVEALRGLGYRFVDPSEAVPEGMRP